MSKTDRTLRHSVKHITFLSGGLASWKVFKDLVAKHGIDSCVALFTDTLIEDVDLYRFIVDVCAPYSNKDLTRVFALGRSVPEVTDIEARKLHLVELRKECAEVFPFLVWICEGRTPWEVFKYKRWLGNSRLAHCSFILKQKPARAYLEKNFNPELTRLYLGIGWEEPQRKNAITTNWVPYTVEFPLCDPPYYHKQDLVKELEADGIALPALYLDGFSHNNCSGQCVKGGQGHWVRLLQKYPERYQDAVEREKEVADYLGGNPTIISRLRKKVKSNISLEQLREEYKAKNPEIDEFDIGGCGCFSEPSAELE